MSVFSEEFSRDPAAAEELAKVISSMTPFIEWKTSSVSIPGYEKEDLRQEALIALFSAMETYRPGMGASFDTYASNCISNRITDAARRAAAGGNRTLNESSSLEGEGDALPDGSPDPADAAETKEELETVLKAMELRLSDFERKVMVRWLRGFSASEPAEALGRTPRSVSNALDRARRKLKEGNDG